MSQLWSLLLYARYECGCPSVNTLITSHYAISTLIGAYNKISVVIGPKQLVALQKTQRNCNNDTMKCCKQRTDKTKRK